MRRRAPDAHGLICLMLSIGWRSSVSSCRKVMSSIAAMFSISPSVKSFSPLSFRFTSGRPHPIAFAISSCVLCLRAISPRRLSLISSASLVTRPPFLLLFADSYKLYSNEYYQMGIHLNTLQKVHNWVSLDYGNKSQ
nr:MAG TPA: hypothetical protein [Caudoviricetes sp.]